MWGVNTSTNMLDQMLCYFLSNYIQLKVDSHADLSVIIPDLYASNPLFANAWGQPQDKREVDVLSVNRHNALSNCTPQPGKSLPHPPHFGKKDLWHGWTADIVNILLVSLSKMKQHVLVKNGVDGCWNEHGLTD